MKFATLAIARIRSACGQTMAEYAVTLGVISIAVVTALAALSTGVSSALRNVLTAL